MRNSSFRKPRFSGWIIIAIIACLVMWKAGKSRLSSKGLLGDEKVVVDNYSSNEKNSNFAPGLPVKNIQGTKLLYRAGYISCYNPIILQPDWVAWTLTREHASGKAQRDNESFTADEEVSFPRADTFDYISSGYDRGHMCPAADNKWSREAMTESFLMTNICPQNPELNRGDWNEIEQQCRVWAKQYGKIYIVCGPIFLKGKHKKIGKHKIPVPDAFFKVILRTSPDTEGIGFICRNTNGSHPKDFYVNSIKEVERITGYKLFPKIDRSGGWTSRSSLKNWKYRPSRYK